MRARLRDVVVAVLFIVVFDLILVVFTGYTARPQLLSPANRCSVLCPTT